MCEKTIIDKMVGANIKRERTRAGYTQEKFSELIGIGTKSLSAIERGTVGVSLTTLLKICHILSITPNSLLTEKSQKNDVQNISERLEHLRPEQFAVINDIICKVLESFHLHDPS